MDILVLLCFRYLVEIDVVTQYIAVCTRNLKFEKSYATSCVLRFIETIDKDTKKFLYSYDFFVYLQNNYIWFL